MSNGRQALIARLPRIALGVATGILVTISLVIVLTWLAMTATGLGMEDAPTPRYLLLNLLGSFVAALVGGGAAATVGRSGWPPAAVAGVVLAMSLASAAAGQPAWYPITMGFLGCVGVLAGAFLAPRPSAGEPAGER